MDGTDDEGATPIRTPNICWIRYHETQCLFDIVASKIQPQEVEFEVCDIKSRIVVDVKVHPNLDNLRNLRLRVLRVRHQYRLVDEVSNNISCGVHHDLIGDENGRSTAGWDREHKVFPLHDLHKLIALRSLLPIKVKGWPPRPPRCIKFPDKIL